MGIAVALTEIPGGSIRIDTPWLGLSWVFAMERNTKRAIICRPICNNRPQSSGRGAICKPGDSDVPEQQPVAIKSRDRVTLQVSRCLILYQQVL